MSNKKPEGCTENRKITHKAGPDQPLPITVSLPPSIRQQADDRAARCGESRSAYIRRLIETDLRECGVAV